MSLYAAALPSPPAPLQFHVLVNAVELQQLYSAFPHRSNPSAFDFVRFAEIIYPRELAQERIIEGRSVGLAVQATHLRPEEPTITAQLQAKAQAAAYLAQQQAEETAAAQKAYLPSSAFTPLALSTSPFAQTYNPTNTAARILDAGRTSYRGPAPAFGDTYNSNGTNYFYTQQGTSQTAARQQQFARTAPMGSQSARKASHAFVPRITHNRTLAGRFIDAPSSSGRSIKPHPAPYPPVELAGKQRFESRPLLVGDIDVTRRHNISRQYRDQ
jgi:hypothetical protein